MADERTGVEEGGSGTGVPPLPKRVQAIVDEEVKRAELLVGPEDILGDRRKRWHEAVEVRARIARRLRDELGASTPIIGRWMGMNHTSILYLLKHPAGRPR